MKRPPIDVPSRVVSRKRAPKPAPPPAVGTAVAPQRGRVVGLSDDGAYEAGQAVAAALGADERGAALVGVVAVFFLGGRRLAPAPVPAQKPRARPRRKPARLPSGR
jgi:hypothetical protein